MNEGINRPILKSTSITVTKDKDIPNKFVKNSTIHFEITATNIGKSTAILYNARIEAEPKEWVEDQANTCTITRSAKSIVDDESGTEFLPGTQLSFVGSAGISKECKNLSTLKFIVSGLFTYSDAITGRQYFQDLVEDVEVSPKTIPVR
jgi:hypothetical protein